MNGMYEIPTLYDIAGSKSFYDKADVGMCVYRNFETNVTSVHVQKVKFKHVGETGLADFKYCLENSRYLPCDADGTRYQEDRKNLLVKDTKQTTIPETEWTVDPDDQDAWMSMKNHRNTTDLPF